MQGFHYVHICVPPTVQLKLFKRRNIIKFLVVQECLWSKWSVVLNKGLEAYCILGAILHRSVLTNFYVGVFFITLLWVRVKYFLTSNLFFQQMKLFCLINSNLVIGNLLMSGGLMLLNANVIKNLIRDML